MKIARRLWGSVGLVAATTAGMVGAYRAHQKGDKGLELHRRLPITVSMIVVASAVLITNVGPAAAATSITNGVGAFTAVAAPTFFPGPVTLATQPCSVYTTYHANVVSGTMVADINSALTSTWAEGPNGTYNTPVVVPPLPGVPSVPDCPDPNTAASITSVTPIPNFTGTLTGLSGLQVLDCHLSDGTYQRGNLAFGAAPKELNIRYTFSTLTPNVGNGCTGLTAPLTIDSTIPSVSDPTTPGSYILSACAGIIAPPGCALAPAGTTPIP